MNISHTATLLASRRALATEQGSKLIQDPYAQHFSNPEYMQKAISSDSRVHYVLMRHRKMDDVYRKYADHYEQVVLLGSGFDTKFQRFPGLWGKHIEIEKPEMKKLKSEILKANHLPIPAIHTFESDLSPVDFFNEILRLIDPESRTLFIAEGFFMYFTEQHIFDFFEMAIMHLQRTEKAFAFDMIDRSYLLDANNRAVHERIKKNGETVLTCMDREPFERFFGEHGIQTETFYPSDLQREYYGSEWSGNNDKFVMVASTRER